MKGYMRIVVLAALFCVSAFARGNDRTGADETEFVLVEAESFVQKGGWCVDQQFMDQMGSPYLIAHGMGVPVEDATTSVQLKKGLWNVWVRTYNWTSPWTDKEGPGAFSLSVGGKALKTVLGTTGSEWGWQHAGAVKVRGGKTEIRLHDLTGFDGRCDAVLLVSGASFPKLPTSGEGLSEFRKGLSGTVALAREKFDFVVVGGGIAGMCAAVAAARNGLKVALVNDRPVLGGNNSSEVRVHLGGSVEVGPNEGLGRMIREFGHTKRGNAGPASNYEDDKKLKFINEEKNVRLFAPYHAVSMETDPSDGRIICVKARHIENGSELVLEAPLFADCTGDGTIGTLAGADWTQGREARSEYGESLAPEEADSMTMGASVQWYTRKDSHPTSFPEFSYGLEFNDSNCEKVTMGEWTWETGMHRDQVLEAEFVRDYGLLVVYSNWSWLKNHSGDPKFSDRSLDWVAYIAGKRESRRLLGDYVLTQNDIDGNIAHDDASFTTTWSIDLHFPDSSNSRNFPGGEFKSATVHNWIYPYAVPYRCLYSRNVANLFMAGRDISCTHVALGTVRVMRTTGMMGEVVGMAASLCHKYGCLPRGVYSGHLDELKAMMKAGAGRRDVPLSDQTFNEQNCLLAAPANEAPERKTIPTRKFYGCRATLESDTLRLSNSLIERTFLWNGGDLISLSIKDLKTGRVFANKSAEPSFVVTSETVPATDGKFSTRMVASDGIHPVHLEAEVSYSLGTTRILRVFRLYDNCPAIACDNYVCGADTSVEREGDNAADNKNIESAADMKQKKKRSPYLETLSLDGVHWHCRAVEFFDVTDWNNNLVAERDFIPYRRTGYRGNLLFARDGRDGNGFFFLKEAPCSSVQLGYPGSDFICEFGNFTVSGIGASEADLKSSDWVKLYSCVTGVFGEGELSPLRALRAYQKNIREHRPERDEMIMMNTWGDRSQDSKVNEVFCLAELDKAARLGVTHFQIDDGWQEGKSPNSAVAKGSFRNIWDNPLYWTPAKDKYPHGLAPVVEKAKELGIELGLWFNPSVQNDFEDWEKDVEAVVKLYREYGIRVFKIDGLSIPTKKAETNLRKFFDTVLEKTDNQVVFNLDVTAGRRGGYNMFNEYGNIFLENRYTDWGNYYPYQTLRNLWQLSRYVPAEHLQVEFLNKWRNSEKYAGDPFAPSAYSFDYVFATSMAGQPLAWMEASNLPEEAYGIAGLVGAYRKVMKDFHKGTVLPIGEEPSGRSWTGFQSVSPDGRSGFVLVYRELNERGTAVLDTWLPENAFVEFTKVLGSGEDFSVTAGRHGAVEFSLPKANGFVMYKYKIVK